MFRLCSKVKGTTIKNHDIRQFENLLFGLNLYFKF